MTREEAIEKLEAFAAMTDIEVAHSGADIILTQFLTSLGYKDVVRVWKKVKKWYS